MITTREVRATGQMSRPPYPHLVPAQTAWIGYRPSHWDEVAVRYLFQVHNGATPSSDEPSYWDGEIAWVTPEDLGALRGDTILATRRRITSEGFANSGTTLAPAGSLVISTRAPIGHVAIAGVPLCSNQGCRILQPRQPISERYFYYHLIASKDQLRALGRGSTFTELSRDALAAVKLLRPPLDEQRAIAAFLDRETAQIDALIAKKERLIELLQEKRTALISHAVTKGLDPTVPTRDSGIPWIGRIPAHWELKRLMHLTDRWRPIMYGIVLPGPNVDEGVWIVKGGDVAPGRLRPELLDKTTFEIESRYKRSRLIGGDIVFAIRGSIGSAEMVPAEIEGANLTQDAARIAPKAGINGYWLLYAVRSKAVFAQLDAGATGATIRGINIRDLKRAYVPVPPPTEQAEIAEYLCLRTQRLDALLGKVEAHIRLLKDFRTALISATVTGKIDVRGEVV